MLGCFVSSSRVSERSRIISLSFSLSAALLSLAGLSCDTGEKEGSGPTQSSSSGGVADASQPVGIPGLSNSGSSAAPLPATPGNKNDSPCAPGMVRPCAEDERGVPVYFPGQLPQGRCRFGSQLCLSNSRWGSCTGLVAPKAQDDCSLPDDDSNCNGVANEGCECVESPASARPCGTDVGVCELGVQSCVQGRWGACERSVGRGPERCDGQGLDEDCDGEADTDDSDCSCIDGDYPCELAGALGDCALGIQRCQNGTLSECKALYQVEPESCGGRMGDPFGRSTGDENCNGKVDEQDGPQDPLGCELFMVDADGDGWGAMGPSFREQPEQATYGCFCGRPPKGLSHMVLARAGRENADCGDCPVGGKFVRPDQKEFFAERSGCLELEGWKSGAFDYDCAQGEERRYVGQRQGKCAGDPSVGDECRWSEKSTGFWKEAKTPACGESAVYVKCTQIRDEGRDCENPFFCEAVSEDSLHRQECR